MDVDFLAETDLARLRRGLGDAQAPALLLSAAAGPQGRFDVLPLVDGAPLVVPYPGHPQHDQRLAELQAQLLQMPLGGSRSDVIFEGGWLLYLAYEFGSVFEPSVPCHRPEFDEPLALLWRAPAVLLRDRHRDRVELHGTDLPVWQERLRLAHEAAKQAAEHAAGAPFKDQSLGEDDPRRFREGVARRAACLLAG